MANSQPGFGASYTSGTGSFSLNELAPMVASRAPTTADSKFPIGKIWSYPANSAAYILVSKSSSSGGLVSATWDLFGGGGASIDTITGDSGGALSPSSGNLNILGTASQITTTGLGSTLTLALASSITGLTSVSSTTFVTSATLENLNITANDITAAGSNSNIDIDLIPKGSGVVHITNGGLFQSAGDIINFHSSSAADVTIEVTNSDNTSTSSRAGFEVAVGGTSAGDPYLKFLITGSTSYTLGIDNDSFDLFTISESGSLGTGNVLTIAPTSKTVNFFGPVLNDFDSTSFNPRFVAGQNNNTASATSCFFQAYQTSDSGGDPYAIFQVLSSTVWSLGLDNSTTNNDFVISKNITLGTSNVLSIDGSSNAWTISNAVTLTTGSLTLTNGNLALSTIGNGITIKEGTNARIGSSVLVAGSVTVSNTSVTNNTVILLTCQIEGGTPGFLRISTRTPGTSFVITSSNGADTSTVGWVMFERVA